MTTRIELKADEARKRLANLIEANRDLTPLMKNIAGFMHDRVEENFAQEGRPKWEPLSPVTVKRRGSSSPILQVSGQLAASVTESHDDHSASVGTNKIYGRVMQEGAKKGEFAKNIPWGNIPARPFLMLTEDDQGDQGLLGLVIDYQKNAAG